MNNNDQNENRPDLYNYLGFLIWVAIMSCIGSLVWILAKVFFNG